MHDTKQPHYIPETYSINFCTEGTSPSTGFLYRKSNPEFLKPVQPKDWGKISYYTSITRKDGTRDTRTIEEIYCATENEWPKLVEIFQNKEDLSIKEREDFFSFITLMVFRVPNFRMRYETSQADDFEESIKIALEDEETLDTYFKNTNCDEDMKKRLKREGRGLIQRGEVFVVANPEISLVEPLKYFSDIYDIFSDLNWVILENLSSQGFITSDNPVVWHDFIKTERTGKFIPYSHGMLVPTLEVIFPLTNKLIVIGTRRESKKKFSYEPLNSHSFVKKLNRYSVISAEDFVFSNQSNLRKLVKKHKDVVPRTKFIKIPSKNGIIKGTYIGLGSPHKLPKWD